MARSIDSKGRRLRTVWITCLCVGVALLVASTVTEHIGARINGMTMSMYMTEKDGRYVAMSRGYAGKVMQEVSAEQFASRREYERVAQILMVAGIVLAMTAVAIHLALDRAQRRRAARR